MRNKIVFFFLIIVISKTTNAQYKNDNVLYRLIYLQDLCKAMNENPGYLLLDVRSPGEYEDTSGSLNYNIGRFKNAKNITIQELGGRLNEINNYKDQPVFVYCSHSQRSRRASKMLADSGFTKVFNINSGFSSTHLLPASSIECLLAKTEFNTGYKILSPPELYDKMNKAGKDLFLLDVRPDSIFNSMTGSEKLNVYGSIKGSTHIAVNDLETGLNKIPQNKEIIVIDTYGDESANAAKWLIKNGYKNISILFNGIDAVLSTSSADLPDKSVYLIQKSPYKIIPVADLSSFIKINPAYQMVDVRSKEEFANKATDAWRNIGQVKDAVNIPSAEIAARNIELSAFKNKPVILYSFTTGDEVYVAARKLTDAGFKDVSILAGGLFSLRWTAHNIKGKEGIDAIVVNVPEVNL